MPLTSLTLSDCRVVEAGNRRSNLGAPLTGAQHTGQQLHSVKTSSRDNYATAFVEKVGSFCFFQGSRVGLVNGYGVSESKVGRLACGSRLAATLPFPARKKAKARRITALKAAKERV